MFLTGHHNTHYRIVYQLLLLKMDFDKMSGAKNWGHSWSLYGVMMHTGGLTKQSMKYSESKSLKQNAFIFFLN